MEKYNYDEQSALQERWKEDYERACMFFEEDSPKYDVNRGIAILADIHDFYSVQTIMEKLAIYAAQGNEAAIYALNEWYKYTPFESCYIPEDSEQVLSWLKIVAQSGNPRAQNELGYYYYCGMHVEQDYNAAARWSALAATENEQAAYNFAEVYLTGKTTKIDECEASEPLYYAAKGDCKPAQEWLLNKAESGFANAQFYLGVLTVQGQGAYNQDIEAGLCWLKKAADQDFFFALNVLAMIYEDGILIPQDLNKCIALLQRAVELGDMDAQDRLGTMYDEGKGVQQDYAQAIQLYEQSALQGEVSAMVHLAHHYRQGLGTEKDLAKAENWFRIAASRHSDEGLLGLAMINEENGKLEEAIKGYAEVLENSEYIEFFNDDSPEYWLEEIDEKMSPEYMSWSCKLSSSVDDMSQEEPKIQTYAQLLEAADGGDAKAQHDLGYHYYWGGENYEQDIMQAVSWFELAANNGHAQSAYNLGVLYADGDVPIDLAMACRWFKKAADIIKARRN